MKLMQVAIILHTVSTSIGPEHDVLAEWRQFVQQNFPISYQNQWQEYLEHVANKIQKSPVLPEPERLRTCTTFLKSIIRSDLPSEHSALLIERIEKTAIDITNQMSDLCAIIRALMYQAVQRGFVVQNGVIHLNDSEQVRGLNIAEILPECKVRNKDALISGKYIPVAPLPGDIPKNAGSDFYKLFSAEFVQRAFTRYISAATVTEHLMQSHPLWHQLHLDIPFDITKLPGMVVTSTSAAATIGTNISNMWQGNIFDYSLKRILLIYFRVTLAPNREQRYMNMMIKKAEQNSQAKETQRNQSSQSSNRQKARKERKFQKKCVSRITSAADSAQQDLWSYRLSLSNQRLYELAIKRGRSVSKDSQDTIMMDATEDYGYEEDSDSEDEDLDNYDADHVSTIDSKSNQAKETSAKKITQLTAFTKKQLLARTPERALIEKIKIEWSDTNELSKAEFDAILHICSVLMPFIPPPSQKQAIAFQLPIVILCNFLQSASGYSQFNREISPSISAGKIHALDIDAVAIYEMLASNSEQQNFTIKDAHDVPISSTRWAIANKDATFAAFFDLRKIKNVCNDYGLDFQHRLAYRSDDSVALVGELKQGVHAATSWYVQRRKYKLSSKQQGVASKTLTDREKQSVKDLNGRINELIAALRPVTAQLKATKAYILDLKSQRKSLPAGVDRQALYAELQIKKTQRNGLQSKIFNLKDQVKVCKAIKYNTLYIKVLFTNMW